MDLTTRFTTVGGAAVLSLSGEIDLSSVPRLHDALQRAALSLEGATLHVDLDGVYVCDDTGLGVLLGAAGRLRSGGGDMVVVCSAGPLRQRLALTGFDRAISVVESLSAAPLPRG